MHELVIALVNAGYAVQYEIVQPTIDSEIEHWVIIIDRWISG